MCFGCLYDYSKLPLNFKAEDVVFSAEEFKEKLQQKIATEDVKAIWLDEMNDTNTPSMDR